MHIEQYCGDSNTLLVNSVVYHLLEPQHVPKGITVERTRIQNIDDIHLHWQVCISLAVAEQVVQLHVTILSIASSYVTNC